MNTPRASAIASPPIKDAVFSVLVYLWFTLFSLAVFYPLWFVTINSFNGQLIYGTALYWPREWSLVNYEFALRDSTIVRSLMITVLRVVSGVCVMVFLNAMCAFGLRKRSIALRRVYLVLFTIPLFFGGGLIPQFLNLKQLGLLDTFAVYILPDAWHFFYLVILMSAFNDIHESIEESARMDGASSFLICFRIYIPMTAPVIAAIALFAGVHHWGAWFDAVYFVRSEGLRTFAAFLIRLIQNASLTEELQDMLAEFRDTMNVRGLRFAVIVIAIVPVLIVNPLIQKFFVKGIRIGSIK